MVLNDPGVFRTAIVCATVAFLALIGVSAWIIVSGHDLYVLSLAVLGPVVTLLTAILRRQKEQTKRLDQIQAQTDPRQTLT